jgi:hypothetical protein
MNGVVSEPCELSGTRNKRIFRPRSTPLGWASSLIVFAMLVAAPALASLNAPARGQRVVLALMCLLPLPVLFFTAILPTMRYEVGGGEIVPRCGPFHWRISVAEIRRIREGDLEYLAWSEGWKLPGYTLFSIRYGGIGSVRMCATSMCKRVLVIETDACKWGLTPADTRSFLDAVGFWGETTLQN